MLLFNVDEVKAKLTFKWSAADGKLKVNFVCTKVFSGLISFLGSARYSRQERGKRYSSIDS